MTTLSVSSLRVAVEGREILRGIDLEVSSGEVHAVMGPNGSGKSTLAHVIMGRPGYEVLEGQVTLDGVDILVMTPWQRAQAGLFITLQYPIEVPGVPLESVLAEALLAQGRDVSSLRPRMEAEADAVGLEERFLDRPLNVDLSGGERKRNETIQLCVLEPKIAVLDELDSGLDVDALRAVSRRIEGLTHDGGVGVLAITHYTRLLHELHPDVVHVLSGGRIARTGGPELGEELENTGYVAYRDGEEAPAAAPPETDPFADPLA